ncbi:MAG: glucose/galactose MFS transporter, partial [Flavobacteriales bacterium]
ASGFLVTAIVGGAIIPLLYGMLADEIGLKGALNILVLCYTYILIFGWRKARNRVIVNRH